MAETDNTTEYMDEAEEIDEDDVVEVFNCGEKDGTGPMEEDDEDADEVGMNEDGDELGMAEDEDEVEMNEEDPVDYVDHSSRRFTLHSQPVFCLGVHPSNSNICATGGADDFGYIWNCATGNEILQLSGHKDSVSCVEFSKDGMFLASASVDGVIRIWRNCDSESGSRWEFTLELEGTDEVTWLSWHPKGNVLLAGCSDGMSSMWQIPSGTNMQVFAGHTAMVTCGCFTPDGKAVVTASESGTAIVWDPKTGQPTHKINMNEGKFKFRTTTQDYGVGSIATNQASTFCVVGGISNGGIRIISLQSGIVVAALDDHQAGATIEVGIYEPLNPATGVPLIVSAGTDGLVCLYDAASFKLRTSMRHQDTVTSFTFHKNLGQVTTGSLDRSLITWDLRTGAEVRKYMGHHDLVHQVKITSNEQRLISCSDDGTACVFDLSQI